MTEKTDVVLITGATSIIGQATALLFDDYGAELVLIGRSEEKTAKLAEKLQGNHAVYILNSCRPESIDSIVEDVIAKWGRIDCLIQNTAIYPYQPIESLGNQCWSDTLDITLTVPFLFTKACINSMKQQKNGRIIFISSIAGETIGLPNMSAYAAAKAGLNGFMRTAAIELAKYHITVNSISPGKTYDASSMSEAEMKCKLASVPLQQFVDPADVAAMAFFLASANAANITGQNMIIDGGQSILGEQSHLAG